MAQAQRKPPTPDPEAEAREALARLDEALRESPAPAEAFSAAAATSPVPAVFERWLVWARGQADPALADEAAQAWLDALPAEALVPLLHLLGSAEARGAFKQALWYLEHAEKLAPGDTRARGARPRLLVAIACRHLANRRPDLAAHAAADLARLPHGSTERGAALVLALRCACARAGWEPGGDPAGALARAWGGPARATVLVDVLAGHCHLGDPRGRPEPEHVAAALALLAEHGLAPVVPRRFRRALAQRTRQAVGLGAAELLALARAALRTSELETAFAATALGLALPDRSLDGAFLVLRARSLPSWTPRRRRACLAAAAELARRGGDAELLAEATAADLPCESGELLRVGGPVAREALEAVLRREREAAGYPGLGQDREPPLGCRCAACQARLASRVGAEEEAGDEADEDLDLEEATRGAEEGPEGPSEPERRPLGWGGLDELSGLPPRLLALFLEAAARHGSFGRMPTPEEIQGRDPALFARIEQAVAEFEKAGGTFPVPRGARRRRA